VKHLLLRLLGITGFGILIGFISFHESIFTPTMRSLQFAIISVSSGLAYAFLKSPTRRNLFLALGVWYCILVVLIRNYNQVNPVQHFAFVGSIAAAMTAAIVMYEYAITRPYVSSVVLRVIFAGAIISIVNGGIVVVLSYLRLSSVPSFSPAWYNAIRINIEGGAIIGLAVGAGIELSEYGIRLGRD
jgi:hypothetical protein